MSVLGRSPAGRAIRGKAAARPKSPAVPNATVADRSVYVLTCEDCGSHHRAFKTFACYRTVWRQDGARMNGWDEDADAFTPGLSDYVPNGQKPNPVPKPTKAEKVVSFTSLKPGNRNHESDYGARDGSPKWSVAKKRIWKRDQEECQVCGLATKDPPHHIKYVSDLGNNFDFNLILLCTTHHQAVHKGQISTKTLRELLLEKHGYLALVDILAGVAA
jgi:hypothetical protein